MEGPYRDLGGGFVRLTGSEGVRRSPSRINTVEDALFELLRNAGEAGARNVYVASSLRQRRYRTLTVIDDGHGMPESHKELVFEPGVTSRHLEPTASAGAGLSLYHLKNAALEAEALSARAPTAIRAIFDTETLPERSLQSNSRPSNTNLLATLNRFMSAFSPEIALYYASPARILATLYRNRIIQLSTREPAREMSRKAERLGIAVSLRTVQRMLAGSIPPAERVRITNTEPGSKERPRRREGRGGPVLRLDGEEMPEIEDILGRIAGARYLRIGEVKVETRPGELTLRASVYEPEEEYE